jgi:hypothetical protein
VKAVCVYYYVDKHAGPDVISEVKMEFLSDRETRYEREKIEDQERWDEYQRTGEFVEHERVVVWLQALAEGYDMPIPRPIRPQASVAEPNL